MSSSIRVPVVLSVAPDRRVGKLGSLERKHSEHKHVMTSLVSSQSVSYKPPCGTPVYHFPAAHVSSLAVGHESPITDVTTSCRCRSPQAQTGSSSTTPTGTRPPTSRHGSAPGGSARTATSPSTGQQRRRHGFLSGGGGGGRIVGSVANLPPKYSKNRNGHRIWATSFSNLGDVPLLTFYCGDASPPSHPRC